VDNKELAKSHTILRKRLKKTPKTKKEAKLSRNNTIQLVTKPKSSISAFFGRPLLGIRCSYGTHSASQDFSPWLACGAAFSD